MADIYPRKGQLTLLEAKSMLSTDDVFTNLSDTEKKDFINDAQQQVSNFRNEEGKEEYEADTVDIDLVP